MRLGDILFTQGFGTRYDCAALAASGRVKIGGAVHSDPDEEIDTDGLVFECGGTLWPYAEKAVIAMNKPAGYECSMKPSAHPSVMTLLPPPLRRRGMQPVGRLDADTTGLLLFTDDGALQHRLIHPKRHVAKVYEAECRYEVTPRMIERLLSGVVLDDDPRPVSAAAAEKIGEKTLRMTLTQGKYHQVKRMIAACSNRCEALRRTAVGKYALPGSLAPGAWVWIRREDVL